VAAIEYAFNVFPATPTSSAVLQVAHLVILVGIRPPEAIHMDIVDDNNNDDDRNNDRVDDNKKKVS